MSEKLTADDLAGMRAHYADKEKHADVSALLDHIDAVEQESDVKKMLRRVYDAEFGFGAWPTQEEIKALL